MTNEKIDKTELANNFEFQMLSKIQGVNPDGLLEQAGLKEKPVETPLVTPPPTQTPPVQKPEDVAGKPPVVPPVAPLKITDDQLAEQRALFLKEIFGDKFKTVEEAKTNIPVMFKEVEDLRQVKTELEGKLSSKPKTNFADDEVALYNEFVKETGHKNYGLFQKINNTELATIDPMEALITKYMFDNPEYVGKDALVRKYFETKYSVNPDEVEEEQLQINKIGMAQDGSAAKKALQAIKEKLKIPEPVVEQTKVEPTPEQKAALKAGWNSVGSKVSESLSKLKIPIKNSKDPLLDYEVSESEQKEITDFVTQYAVENQMELNETNVRMVAFMVQNQLMLNKLPEIVHSVFEKARSMTEEQVHAMYENPSPSKNNDKPDTKPDSKTESEKNRRKAFEAELHGL